MAKHKVTGIKKDAIVKLDIGAGFYFRISQMLIGFGAMHWPGKEIGEVMEHLKDNEPRDENEYHLVTLLSLVHEIEAKAQEQDLIITDEITLPDTPETSPES